MTRVCPQDPQKVIIDFVPDEDGKLPVMYTGDEIQKHSNFGDVWYPIIRGHEPSERGQIVIYADKRRPHGEELHLGRHEGYSGIRRIRRYP